MPAKKTTLNNLLDIAASNAAAKEAEAKKAAAEIAEAEKAKAEGATDRTFAIIADVTGATMKVGGFPAVTAFMGRLADYAVTGVPAPGSSGGGTPDPALVAERDELEDRVATLTSQRDVAEETMTEQAGALSKAEKALSAAEKALSAVEKDKADIEKALSVAEKDKVDAETALSVAKTANSNLKASLDLAVSERAAAKEALANERTSTWPNSLAQKLNGAQTELNTAKAKMGELPELDLDKVTIGGAVKVPLDVAEEVNRVRNELRTLFGL